MSFTYEYPRPRLAADSIVFAPDGDDWSVLLIQRDHEPFAGRWAFPGGFVEMDEDLDEAARRELAEETGLSGVALEQLGTFGAVDRDPRERTVTVIYWGIMKEKRTPQAASDARAARWFTLSEAPALAFDHDEILRQAIRRLRQSSDRESAREGAGP